MLKFWLNFANLLRFIKKQAIILVLVIVISEILQLLGPFILKMIIDNLTVYGAENIKFIALLVALLFLLDQVTEAISWLLYSLTIKLDETAAYVLNINAQRKMVSLDLAYHELENTGSKISKIQRGIDKVTDLLADLFWQVIPTLVQTLLTFATLLVVNWRFALIFILFAPLFIFITAVMNKKVYPWRKKRHDDYEAATGIMAESIMNISTVKSFAQEQREIKRFSDLRERIKSNTIQEKSILLKYGYGRDTLLNVSRILVMLLGIFMSVKGNLSIGSLVFIITINDKAMFSLYHITRLYDRIMETSEAINRIIELEGAEPRVKSPENGIKPTTLAGNFRLSGLAFSYNDNGEKALDGIDLKIPSGSVTALVGPSGGGKTTLARMLYRHYDPLAGTIMLDGKELKEYDLAALRSLYAIVQQDIEIFDDTIKNNIAYGRPDAGFEEIEAAAKLSNSLEFIEKLPAGFDTCVGERGIKLSGGQKQRIGIARAVLVNPRILIFDEATSSLDSRSERLIQEALEKIRKDRTIIIIAHRLSTIQKADKIVVLENGRVIEQGSHTQLVALRKGLYAKLMELQRLGDVA